MLISDWLSLGAEGRSLLCDGVLTLLDSASSEMGRPKSVSEQRSGRPPKRGLEGGRLIACEGSHTRVCPPIILRDGAPSPAPLRSCVTSVADRTDPPLRSCVASVADKTDRWHHLAILEGEELSQW